MRNFSFPIGDFEEGVMWVSQTVPPQNSTLVHCGWHWEGRCFAQHLCNSELVDQAKMDYIFVCSGHCCGHSQKWGLGVRSRIGWGWELNFRLISSVTSCKCLHDSSLKSLTLWIQRGMWSAAARIGFRPGLHVCLWMWLRLIRANSVFGILLNGAEVFSCHFVRPGAYSYLVCREINVKSEYAEKPEPLLFSVRTALTFVPVSIPENLLPPQVPRLSQELCCVSCGLIPPSSLCPQLRDMAAHCLHSVWKVLLRTNWKPLILLSRNPSGAVPLCPDFHHLAVGRTAHGLPAPLDVGFLHHLQ